MAVDNIPSVSNCPFDEKLLLAASGKLAFASMGDVRRATSDFNENSRNLFARETLNAYRNFRLFCIGTSLDLLRKSELPANALISARLKRLRSISRKIKRGHSGSISEMDDIIGFRVICESLKDAIALGQRIEKRLGAKVKNYLTEQHSAELGYRAMHGIVRFDQPFQDRNFRVRFEIQVRTWYQHLWACWCESHGERAKEGFRNGEQNDPDTLNLISELRRRSVEISEWENKNSDAIPRNLPRVVDPYNIAIAWFDSRGIHGFAPFSQNIGIAIRRFNRLERDGSLNPLLLLGISDVQGLKDLLMETHPRFMHRRSLDPQFWMPHLN